LTYPLLWATFGPSRAEFEQIGAVPTRNSVYVLPNTEQCREDFEWIRSEIVALGGEATVFAADALNPEGMTVTARSRAVSESAAPCRPAARKKSIRSIPVNRSRSVALARTTAEGEAVAPVKAKCAQ
jgi:hypothetical protein